MKKNTKFLLIVIAILCTFKVTTQNIKSPSDFLGYELGSRFTRHHQVIEYFKYLAESIPNQLALKKYGETYENRPLYVAYLSSEENIKNLEVIQQNNLKNAGIVDGNSNTTDIAIVWLSYNVHGDEASSTEVAMKTIFKLVTEKETWLKNTLVIIDPCVNPDGRDRYANWFNQTANNPYNIDKQASEHSEPWPGGRPNHYLFDLNRDWAWATQIETKSRLKIYNKWLPHIHVDFHEQDINDPYYFAPAAEPFHEIISDWQRKFQTQIGKNNAKYFDKNGWLYFTKESYDLLYPSYGDTYPTFMGAIGMTYEQAGHGKGGLGILNDEGDVLTLVDRINHHTTSGLSTIEMASKNASELNSEFKKFFNTSGLKYKSFVLQGEHDKIEGLKKLLDKHEIAYGNASASKVSGFIYDTNKEGTMNTSSKDLVVSTNQPKGKMAHVLFEPNTKLSDTLTYDITAWSLAYAYGLKAIASKNLVASVPSKSELITNTKNTKAIGYITKWNSIKDAEFLTDLLKQNIKIRFTEKPLKTENNLFNRGSLIIIRSDNKKIENFDKTLTLSANKFNRELNPVTTAFSQSGPDFGSPDIKLVNKQKIALLSGDETESLNYGAIWHFFEQQLHYPISSINTNGFNNINLNKYNVLIIPDGNYKTVLIDSTSTKKIQSWVKNGGKIIALEGALKVFANKKGFKLKTNKSKEALKKEKDTINLIPYANREREALKKSNPGAIFKTKIDNTHPMAFGYENNYFTLKTGTDSYKLLGNDNYNIAYLDNAENVSGFVGSDALKQMKQSLIFGEERLGKGNIIYMVDDVTFRSFWENGKLFLVNAIFFVNNDVFETSN